MACRRFLGPSKRSYPSGRKDSIPTVASFAAIACEKLTQLFLADCGFDVHKKYVHKVEELCVGPNTFTSSASNASAVTKKSDKKGLFGITRILSERELSSRKSSVPPAASTASNNGPQG